MKKVILRKIVRHLRQCSGVKVHWQVFVQGQLYRLSYLIRGDQKDLASIQILQRHSMLVSPASYFAAMINYDLAHKILRNIDILGDIGP